MTYFASSGIESFANNLFATVNNAIASVLFVDVLFWRDGVQFPLAVAWLIVGALFLTIKMRLVNLRFFRHAILLTMGKYDKAEDQGEVSHFKALATALSATVGLGNIAGVAIAVSLGGPGATFWMIIAGLLGMSSKFSECTLAQMYRQTESSGHILGGPMLYLNSAFSERGLPAIGKAIAILFAILCIFGSYGGGGSFQVNQSLNAIAEVFPFFIDNKWVYGILMSVLVAIVIIGGLRRIANVTDKIVPLMCGLYLIMSLYVLSLNIHLIPSALYQIVNEAFSPDALYGGFLGALITGFKRAAFSNEAGMGSAAIAHSAAKVEYPVQEGIVALLEPFIDTVVICTMTALVIIITGAYNNPEYAALIQANNGAALTSRALGHINSFFPIILSFIVFLFAYSTIISWSYYGERSFTFIFGPKYSLVYKISLITVIFLGSVTTSTHILEFGDLVILSMAFPNLIGVYLLSGKVRKALDEYTGFLKSGKVKRTS